VASAATELSLAKLALDASQSSFAKIQGMTLFNYI
jgi:flagellar hook-associated protein 3 FlgL